MYRVLWELGLYYKLSAKRGRRPRAEDRGLQGPVGRGIIGEGVAWNPAFYFAYSSYKQIQSRNFRLGRGQLVDEFRLWMYRFTLNADHWFARIEKLYNRNKVILRTAVPNSNTLKTSKLRPKTFRLHCAQVTARSQPAELKKTKVYPLQITSKYRAVSCWYNF